VKNDKLRFILVIFYRKIFSVEQDYFAQDEAAPLKNIIDKNKDNASEN